MKNFKLRKLVAVALAVMTIATVSPIGASAAWKQNSNGWWNTEGSSWSIGWRNINGSWYNFGSDGYMKTGWVNDKGTWYYAAPSGAMQTGWVNDKGTWYFTAPSGAMQTGWVNDGGTWYFTASSGAMQTGVVEVQGKVYYLAPSGAMATGTVAINGTTYNFATSGEAVGDKIPTPTVAFSGNGAQQTPTTTGTTTPTTTDTTGTTTSSGGGGGSSSGGSSSGGSTSGGNTSRDITDLVSGIYSTKLANTLQNHPTLANKISVTTGNPIVVTLKDQSLDSLQEVFNTAQGQTVDQIEARLAKAEGIMDLHSTMVNVNGVSFKQYLAQAEPNYFNSNGSLNTLAIATIIKDNTSPLPFPSKYDKFRSNLISKISGMNTAPQVSISYDGMSLPVTTIVRDGSTIYNTSFSKSTNINGLVSLGDTIIGTYTVYSGTNYFNFKIQRILV